MIPRSLIAIFFGTALVSTAMAEKEFYPTYPKVNYHSGLKAALIKHGEYLTKASDCIACHTMPGGKPFAGGLPMKTPFGTFYSPNITADKETGIGKWTDKQFVRVFHEGIRADGSNSFPVFPYLWYQKMSATDLLAIRAYLNAIPKVHQKNKKPDVPFPFNVRFAQWGWKFLFFYPHKGQFKPDSTKSKQWNRGAYLVQGAGHCGMCHTPINFLGAPKHEYALSGSDVSGMYAHDITAKFTKQYSNKEIVRVFKEDLLLGTKNGKVIGPMKEVNHDSLRYMTYNDLSAIASYIKTVNSKHLPPKKLAKGAGLGKSVYENHCATCHGTGAAGAPKLADDADWKKRMQIGMKALYKNAIVGIRSMPPKGACVSCSDNDIIAAVDYMVGSTDHNAGKKKGKAPTKPSIKRGKQVYHAVCSVCHAEGKLHSPKFGDPEQWSPRIKQNMDTLLKHAIEGFKGHPIKGACYDCTDGDIISAVIYMVQHSTDNGNYRLWY